MDLKGKLSTLRSPTRPEPGDAVERTETLEALRARMAAILGREPPAPPARAAPGPTQLPFVREDGEHGPLWRRRGRLLPSYHVGRMPVDAARDAGGEMLALLALDPALSQRRPRHALFLDTETTGLGGGAGILAFLVGMAWFDDDGRFVLEQLLLRSPADEPALLREVDARIRAADLLVTYNGKSFDLPLLAGRYVMNRLPQPPARAHLDLLHVARRLHKARLGACRLVSLEADVLGFVRDADIDGRQAGRARTPAEAARHSAALAEAALRAMPSSPTSATPPALGAEKPDGRPPLARDGLDGELAVGGLARAAAAVDEGAGVARVVQRAQDAPVAKRHPDELALALAATDADREAQTLAVEGLHDRARRAAVLEGLKEVTERLLHALVGVE